MRLVVVTAIALAALAASAGAAAADPSEYEVESASAAVSDVRAGVHPDFTIDFKLKRDPEGKLPSTTENISVELPPGMLANPGAVPQCTEAELLATDSTDPSNETGCPQDSQVGITEVGLFNVTGSPTQVFEPVFNLVPGNDHPARLGFMAEAYPVLINAELRSDGDYGATARVEGASSLLSLFSASTTLWGVPASSAHDARRITPYEALPNHPPFGVPHTPEGKRQSGLTPVPFTFNPSSCGVPQGIGITAIPYALPSLRATAFAPLPSNSSCSKLRFEPQISIDPTTTKAISASGLSVQLSFPASNFTDPNVPVEAALKKAEVTLPEGITVNPSQADGLAACTEAELARETASSAPGHGCPEASKIGSATGESPLIDKPVEGSLYVAEPYRNPFDSLLAVYMVFRVPDRGVIVKLPLRIELDPKTGQLTTDVDDIPQAAVGSSFTLHFRTGARSPLVTPSQCGSYASSAKLTSWASPRGGLTLRPSFHIESGFAGPCTAGPQPFQPDFTAGAVSNGAGSYSSYYLRITRPDGDQELTRFSATFPPGVVAKLAGVPRCPDSAIAAAAGKTGTEELASPSCPAGSEIGDILAGAGVGSGLTYVRGKAYLAGPYQGSQLSVVGVVPAVAGPFDIGDVVTRQPLRVDPDTAEARIDGSHADPLPHILAGIPLAVRDIRAFADKPEFTLNPTNCRQSAFEALLFGVGLDPFSSADDTSVQRSSRFQTADCAALGFRPRLSFRLRGGTRRGAHPALRAVLQTRPGDANIGATQVTLPRSAFIEQSHFRTICTRVQFAASQCPPGSIYGHVKVFAPLLDRQPFEGPAYLRSSSHQLPDLVFALHGIVDVNVVARIDSVDGRLRASFESVPDAPISKAIVTMQGGKKGLFVNSTNLCHGEHRATVQLTGQNEKHFAISPTVKATCKASREGGKEGRALQTHHR